MIPGMLEAAANRREQASAANGDKNVIDPRRELLLKFDG
jgi:hypothetical protein